MRKALWLALVLVALLAAPARAEPLPPAEIATRLDEAAARAEQGDVAGARALLEPLTEARLDDGSVMAVEPAAWLALLDEAPDEAPTALRAAAASLRAPPATLPADARARLERVLARPEFQPVQPSLWERLLRWLAERLDGLGAPGLDPLRDLSWIAIALASGLVVAGVLWLFWRGLRQNVIAEEHVDPLAGDIPLHATEAQERAAQAAGAGDFREAMRLLYLAALLHLDAQRRIRFDRALTNREVLASVAGDTTLRPLLAPVVAQFDRVWYGHAPFGPADYEAVRGQIEALRALGAAR